MGRAAGIRNRSLKCPRTSGPPAIAPAAERPHLLYLVHRIPYPPRKGDTPADFLDDSPNGLLAMGPIAAHSGNLPVFIADVIAGYKTEVSADIPAEIWHLKTAYRANWGKMSEVLRRIEAARAPSWNSL